MRRVELWALGDDDADLVERLAAGLDDDAARVLAYLLARREHDAVERRRATQLTIRVGTGLGRTAASDALATLEDRGLVTRTEVERDGQGRPPNAWYASRDRTATARRVDRTHARALVDQAASIWGIDREPPDDGSGPGDGTAGSREDGGPGDPDDSGDPDGPGDPDDGDSPVSVGLSWSPNALHLPLYAAEHGDTRNDLSLSPTHYRGSHRALDALVEGDVDVALAGAGSVSRAVAAGAPVVPIAALYQRTVTVLYTTRERFGEPLERADQLRGARIATAVGSETWLLARLFLATAGLLDEVEFVDAEGEESAALLAGDAEVATGAFSDPDDLAEGAATVDVLSVGDHFPIHGPTLVVREETLAGPLPERILAAATQGWAEARRDPVAAARSIADQTGETADDLAATFGDAVAAFGAGRAVRRHGWGWQRSEARERLHAALAHADLTDEA